MIEIKGETVMININDYIVETIAFAHILPISRDYTILVFVGRKKKATCNRFVFALTKFENGELTIVDEVSIPSCEMMKDGAEILLASDSVNINFRIRDARAVTVSYTDHDFLCEEAPASEKFTFAVQIA